MTKSDCNYYFFVNTTASNGSKTIRLWWVDEFPAKGKNQQSTIRHYFLDNGAECTSLVFKDSKGQLWYQGGGWLETLLGKSFKGTSEDIDKLKKYTLYGAAAIAMLILLAPRAVNSIKKLKKQTK